MEFETELSKEECYPIVEEKVDSLLNQGASTVELCTCAMIDAVKMGIFDGLPEDRYSEHPVLEVWADVISDVMGLDPNELVEAMATDMEDEEFMEEVIKEAHRQYRERQ